MDLILDKVGKRFSNKEWIFKDLTDHIYSGDRIALVGNNGSGKSTLIKTLSGMITPTKGSITHQIEGNPLNADQLVAHVCFCAPYTELIEEFSLNEMLDFHFKFKKLQQVNNLDELVDLMYFQKDREKLIKNFSSGMKQRLKLGLSFYSKCSLLLLDEPTSNMDIKGIEWYQLHINNISQDTTVVIASNQKHEIEMVNRSIFLNN
ncbi:MAG: ATP-binding cassette domain-containing protein [Reichenbachiella sp.]